MNRPTSVTAAFWFLLIGVIIDLIFAALTALVGFVVVGDGDSAPMFAAQITAAIVTIVLSVILLLVAFAMRNGRNWARIVVIILSVLGVFSGILSVFGADAGFNIPFAIIGIAINILVIVLLLTKSARAYFANQVPVPTI
ncbi:hypothetical protein [Glaciibacter superstes]|uniref:hypothetical protein n=1 Tax=Glaciibacter superstes TaxID=501023 RepID=UPI0003B3A186|nr:hypothetical protein [Glaciibacter superstes]